MQIEVRSILRPLGRIVDALDLRNFRGFQRGSESSPFGVLLDTFPTREKYPRVWDAQPHDPKA